MNNYQRNLNRLKGFTDGAGARAMKQDLQHDQDYGRGYVDGQKAKREYAKQSATELGVQIREIVPLDAAASGMGERPSSATCQMNPDAPISSEAALQSEPQVRSSAGLSGVELAKKLVSDLTPEERAAPINKLTTVNQVVAAAACFTAMLEAVATHCGKPDND